MIGMNTTNTREKIEPLLLTPREAAKALSVCERTLYALTRAGQLPAVRIGRAVRYDVADLRAWIDRAKQISVSGEKKC